MPTLVEALAGIKIIDIAVGGWHSAAISEFGDLYVWGWNKHGQLGIPVRHKRSIYLLPELIDIYEAGSEDPSEINLVSCGTSHTIILTKAGKLFGTGSTKFSQLSDLSSPIGFIDHFQEINCPFPVVRKIICGFASSFIFSSVSMSLAECKTSENGSSAVL